MDKQGIQHQAGYRSIILHEDFLKICNGSIIQALVLSTLEDLVDTSASEIAFIPMNYKDFVFARYVRVTIADALTQLIDRNLVERRPHTETYDYTYEYRINPTVVQEQLNQLHTRSLKNKPGSQFLFNMTGQQRVIWSLFDGLCAYCRVNMSTTWDHVIPTSKNGTNTNANLVPACRECNMYKGNQDVWKWMEVRRITPCDQLVEIINKLMTDGSVDEVEGE